MYFYPMNKLFSLISISLLSLLGASELRAHALPTDSLVEAAKDALVIYKDEESFVRQVKLGLIAQYQVAIVQPNGSNGLHLRDGASPVNQEFRRLWATLQADFATQTSFHMIWKFGGIPSMDSYANGYEVDNYSYAGIFTAYFDQKIPALEGLSMKVGKVKTLFLDEYIRPNMAIPTVERSLLYHQSLIESNWGMELRYAPHTGSYAYVQLLANDRACGSYAPNHPDMYGTGEGLKGEWGMEDKLFMTAGGKYRVLEGEDRYQDITLQYTHDFNNVYDGRRQSGANNYGMRVKDALTVGHQLREGAFYLDTALLANLELQNADYTRGSGKSIGLSIMPRYRIGSYIELVARYAVMSGRGAVTLGGERYLMKQTTADALVDSANSFYVGANFYLAPEHPDGAKILLGAEYLTTRKGGESAYNGWTYTAALRFHF